MIDTYCWNQKLIKFKATHRLTNKKIAELMSVSVDRVNKWTCKNGNRMEKHFYEFLVLKIESGVLDLVI